MTSMPAEPDGSQSPQNPFQPPTPVVIGLVGGIAAGKSTVAGLFAACGLRHVDADRHAQEVSALPEVLAEVGDRLGPEFVVAGRLDRAALAAHVFREPAAKQLLEQILHPRIRARIHGELDLALASGQSALLDVPLLFEGGLSEFCDTVVFVAADEAVRTARAKERGWQDGELARREQNQLPLADKRQRCDHVIDNGGELAATEVAVAALLRNLEAPA